MLRGELDILLNQLKKICFSIFSCKLCELYKNIFDFPQRVLPRHDFFFSHSSGSFSSAAFPEDEKKIDGG